MVTLTTMADNRIKQENVWVTRYRRESGTVECFKARGHVDGFRDDKRPPIRTYWERRSVCYNGNGRPCGRGRIPCYDSIEYGDWHRTESAALKRVKVLIRRREAMLARETVSLDAMKVAVEAGRLPMTRKR